MKTVAERFGQISLASIVQANQNRGVMDRTIHPIWPGRICGKAFPIEIQPEYGKISESLIENVEKDAILVVGTKEFPSSFLDEEQQCNLKRHGIAGMITDGMVRNAANWKTLKLPVFARGINDRLQNGTEEIEPEHRILCGGVAVSKGDYIFADSDGIIVIPEKNLENILNAAEMIEKEKQKLIEQI